MAEKKPEEKKIKVSNALQFALKATEVKSGKAGEYIPPTADEVVVGLPHQHLSLMYLMDSAVIPISKIIKIAGPFGSCKSALGFEFMRFPIELGGFSHYIENEGGKWSPDLVRSIIGRHRWAQFPYNMAENASQAMELMSGTLKFVEEGGNDKKIIGMLLDSLIGSNTEAATIKMEKDKVATRQFPEAALLWTSYFQTILSPSLIGQPILCVFINHLKDSPSDNGTVNRKSPGGVAQDFFSGVVIWVDPIASAPEERVHREINGEEVLLPHKYRKLRLKCNKTSFGTGHNKININFVWYFDQNNEQVSFWDWDSSTADLLAESQTDWGNVAGQSYTKLQDLCPVKVSNNRYTCEPLGVKNVAANTLGEALRKDPEMMAKLKYFFHIKDHKVWTPSLPPAPAPTETDRDLPKRKNKKERDDDENPDLDVSEGKRKKSRPEGVDVGA